MGARVVRKYAAGLEGTKNNPVKKEKRAKIVIPISRVENQIKTFLAKGQYISEYSAVFLAGVIEYLCMEILELSGKAANEHGRKSIAPMCVRTAIEKDRDLAALSKKVKFKVSGGGI
jgi:histone H2A